MPRPPAIMSGPAPPYPRRAPEAWSASYFSFVEAVLAWADAFFCLYRRASKNIAAPYTAAPTMTPQLIPTEVPLTPDEPEEPEELELGPVKGSPALPPPPLPPLPPPPGTDGPEPA